jgi:AcrR family transcriptional regulator
MGKLTRAARREAIIQAVQRVFAEKGFHGTTTRELAQAAGVSEALLFQHFPTKESLFAAMQEACCTDQDEGRFARLKALEPSAATLVLMVHFLVDLLVGQRGSGAEDRAIHARLILRSLAEDGEFARMALRPLVDDWIPKVQECVSAAVADGEAVAGPVRSDLGGWFVHHLAAVVLFYLLPSSPVVDYPLSRDQLVAQVVWFALRGLGLTEETLRRNYHPDALALLAD